MRRGDGEPFRVVVADGFTVRREANGAVYCEGDGRYLGSVTGDVEALTVELDAHAARFHRPHQLTATLSL